MAVVPFTPQAANIEGAVYRCAGLVTGDSTAVLTISGGNADVTVHVFGTVGGSTVAIQGTLYGDQFNTVDDAYGTAMSYTAIGVVKPVGPAITALQGTVTGGAGVSVTIDVYIVKKIRG